MGSGAGGGGGRVSVRTARNTREMMRPRNPLRRAIVYGMACIMGDWCNGIPPFLCSKNANPFRDASSGVPEREWMCATAVPLPDRPTDGRRERVGL